MAETVIPSVRGNQRVRIHLMLSAGAVASAALAGFILGLIGQGLSLVTVALPVRIATDPGSIVLAILGAGVVLDGAHLASGRLKPPTLGRQVPRTWGRLFPPPVTALLYGARLGVGPMTILSTWMWWAVLAGASVLGVWTTVAVSAWFAFSRMSVNALAARLAMTRGESSHWRSLRRRKRTGWAILGGLAAAMVATVVMTGCGPAQNTGRPRLVAPVSSTKPTRSATVRSTDDGSTPWTTAPVQLEDFVRHSPTTTTNAAEPAVADIEPEQEVSVPELASLLPNSLSGMSVVDDPSVDRFLTIAEAAAIQPDPTEEIALLETRGYRGGWIRAFRSPADDVAVAAVYEFRDEAEAEFYLEDGLITIGGYGGEFFDVPQVPEVRGFRQDSNVDGETIRTLGGAFFHENRWHLLYLVGDPAGVTPEVLIPAIQAFHSAATDSEPVAASSN